MKIISAIVLKESFIFQENVLIYKPRTDSGTTVYIKKK